MNEKKIYSWFYSSVAVGAAGTMNLPCYIRNTGKGMKIKRIIWSWNAYDQVTLQRIPFLNNTTQSAFLTIKDPGGLLVASVAEPQVMGASFNADRIILLNQGEFNFDNFYYRDLLTFIILHANADVANVVCVNHSIITEVELID